MKPDQKPPEPTDQERQYLIEIRRHRTAKVLHSLICNDKDTLVSFDHPLRDGAILIGRLESLKFITSEPVGGSVHDYLVALTELGKKHATPVPS